MKKYKITKPPNQHCKEDSLFPYPTRCLIVGASGSGKTWLLYNIITNYWIPYRHLIIFTKSYLDQAIYRDLQKIFESLKNEIEVEYYDDCENMITVDECPFET